VAVISQSYIDLVPGLVTGLGSRSQEIRNIFFPLTLISSKVEVEDVEKDETTGRVNLLTCD
jgi:hypothetical protein